MSAGTQLSRAMSDDSTHYIEDLEARENASPICATTLAVGEESGEGPITMACFETGC